MTAALEDGAIRVPIADVQRVAVVVPAPSALVHFGADPGTGPAQWIDYPQHPAYAAFSSSGPADRAKALLTFFRYFLLVLCKRLISYELIPAHVRARGGMAFLEAALVNIGRRLVPSGPPSEAGGGPVAHALSSDGVAVVKIESNVLRRVEDTARPLIDALRERRGRRAAGREFMESRSSATRVAHTELFEAVESLLRFDGVLDDVSRYLGRSASLIDVNPQINDPSDDFWRLIFSDLPCADRPARYFHKDASGGDVKAILYLSDVDAVSGPFSYAIGSHKVRSPTLAAWTEETIDQSGLSSTELAARRSFSALPRTLRRKCALGNDLLAGSAVAERMLGAEWVITASRGHLVLFDTKGFHRGGMVEQGERVVLTCVIG